MTPNEYQEAALRTANKNLSQMEQLQNGVMGLTGESGECADLLKSISSRDMSLIRLILLKS